MNNISIGGTTDMERMLQMMRDELTGVGVKELRTPEDVDAMLAETSGTKLVVINSVCGCAAGNARPGIGLALQNPVIPDHLYTVFAGQDRAATERLRQSIPNQPSSSPSVVLFKDGELAYMMHRFEIENRNAIQVARELAEQFNTHCSDKGPSIPSEEFAKMPYAQICGSQFA